MPVGESREAKLSLRRAKALALFIAGKKPPAIATELGIDRTTAWRDVTSELKRVAKERHDLADYQIDVELGQLDTAARVAQELTDSEDDRVRAQGGALAVKVSESRRKLLGLDAPAKSEQSGEVKIVVEYE